jgi:hypothetical protein
MVVHDLINCATTGEVDDDEGAPTMFGDGMGGGEPLDEAPALWTRAPAAAAITPIARVRRSTGLWREADFINAA